jgi:hypothetical protein
MGGHGGGDLLVLVGVHGLTLCRRTCRSKGIRQRMARDRRENREFPPQ